MTSPTSPTSPVVPSAPVVPLRPLGVAELLDGAVRCVRHNLRATTSVAIPVAVLRVVLVGLALLGTYDDDDYVFAQLLAQAFVSALFGTTLAGLLAPVFAGELMGRRVPAAAALRTVGRRTPALLALAVTVAVAQEAGIVALFVGAAWLWGIWAVAAPALVIENLGPWRALRRSFGLVRAEFWRVWGIRTLRWLVVTVLTLFVTLPFTLLAGALAGSDVFSTDSGGGSIDRPGLYVLIASVGSLVALAITTPISAAVDSLLYLDLRMRREGMDLVVGMSERPDEGGASTDGRPRPVTAW